ncbi:uncharacterized protein G2W53_003731 [Senna tora]|uniref:Uncharacterized protein n=1 Tax=Senna tora TaxID=362788 RepID=A0A834X975_9FABA|nr:uncharacterized protein G2W53_003731 [Senna tora]
MTTTVRTRATLTATNESNE